MGYAMTQTFNDLVIADVELAPIVTYAGLALLLLLLLRVVFGVTGWSRVMHLPPLTAVSLYIVLVAILVCSM